MRLVTDEELASEGSPYVSNLVMNARSTILYSFPLLLRKKKRRIRRRDKKTVVFKTSPFRFRFPCFQENKAIQLLESRNESYSPFDDVRMLPFWTDTFFGVHPKGSSDSSLKGMHCAVILLVRRLVLKVTLLGI